MVMLGWSVHLNPSHTFFLGKLDYVVNQYLVHILSLVTDNNPHRKGGERNYFMITKVWDQAGIKLATPGSAVRHVNHNAMWPGLEG